MRDTPLCPPTVGSQPLVEPMESGLLVLAGGISDADLCVVGEGCRGFSAGDVVDGLLVVREIVGRC